MDTSTANKTCTQTSCCREGRRITRVYLQRKRTPGRDSVGRGAAQSDGAVLDTHLGEVLAVLALLTPLSQSVVALLACRITRVFWHSHSVDMIRVGMKLTGVAAVAVAVLMGASSMKPHSEEALLSDWSAPPPVRGLPLSSPLPLAIQEVIDARVVRCCAQWPIFIGLNMLAGALRAASNALTPPPIKMLEMSMAYHQTILVHIAQKFKIPDLLASGPLSAAEVAAKIGSDPVYVERIMYACAANGVFKLVAGPRFVNTALSAVLRVDHPNSVRGLVGHNAEDAYPAWGKLADFLSTGPDLSKASIAWDLAFPQYPFAKDQGGIWAKFEANPAQEDQFGRAMTSIDSIGAAAMVEDGPFAKFSRVVDVGGGRGHFVHRILQAHPQMRGVVVDRAPVVELAKKAWAAEFASLTPTLTPTLNLNPNPNPDSTLTPALTPTPTQKGVGRRVRLGARPRAAGGGRLLRCLDHPQGQGRRRLLHAVHSARLAHPTSARHPAQRARRHRLRQRHAAARRVRAARPRHGGRAAGHVPGRHPDDGPLRRGARAHAHPVAHAARAGRLRGRRLPPDPLAPSLGRGQARLAQGLGVRPPPGRAD